MCFLVAIEEISLIFCEDSSNQGPSFCLLVWLFISSEATLQLQLLELVGFMTTPHIAPYFLHRPLIITLLSEIAAKK